jgi:hypothetical protein
MVLGKLPHIYARMFSPLQAYFLPTHGKGTLTVLEKAP